MLYVRTFDSGSFRSTCKHSLKLSRIADKLIKSASDCNKTQKIQTIIKSKIWQETIINKSSQVSGSLHTINSSDHNRNEKQKSLSEKNRKIQNWILANKTASVKKKLKSAHKFVTHLAVANVTSPLSGSAMGKCCVLVISFSL